LGYGITHRSGIVILLPTSWKSVRISASSRGDAECIDAARVPNDVSI
jgi:hypothetical protein